jgi:dihydrofolate reductase
MAKVFLHISVSLDGFIEDKNGSLDWTFGTDEFDDYINALLHAIDGMIFGRKAHELLAQYWPSAEQDTTQSAVNLDTAKLMNRLPKYAVSRGGYTTGWANSHVIGGDLVAEVGRLRREAKNDIALFAGASAAQSFSDLGLIDEYRLLLNPILLGGGKPLFEPGHNQVKLKHRSTLNFASGAMVLTYARN